MDFLLLDASGDYLILEQGTTDKLILNPTIFVDGILCDYTWRVDGYA